MDWTLGQGDTETAAQLSVALWTFWHIRGHLREGQQWLERVLVHNTGLSTSLRAHTLRGIGTLVYRQGDFDRALTLQRESLTLFQALHDTAGMALVLQQLGLLTYDEEQALSYLHHSLKLFTEIGNIWGKALVRSSLGILAIWQENLEWARLCFEESLTLRREIEDKIGIASSLQNLGYIARKQSDLAHASLLLEEGLALSRELGYSAGMTAALHNLGWVALELNNVEQAASLFVEGLSLSWHAGIKGAVIECLEGLAGVAIAQGQAIRSAHLLGATEHLYKSLSMSSDPTNRPSIEQWITSIFVEIGEYALRTAWSEGQAMSFEQAVTYALDRSKTQETYKAVWQLPPKKVAIEVKSKNAELRLLALGPIRVYRGEELLMPNIWKYSKSRELLFYLLCHPFSTKQHIALALWPDASPASIRSTFRVVLYYLRQALGRSEWILYDGQHYSFNHQLPYWFDMEAFDTAFTKAKALRVASSPDAAQSFEEAVAVWHETKFVIYLSRLSALYAQGWGQSYGSV